MLYAVPGRIPDCDKSAPTPGVVVYASAAEAGSDGIAGNAVLFRGLVGAAAEVLAAAAAARLKHCAVS